MLIIEKYHVFIPENIRDSIRYFNMGAVSFYQKNYKAAQFVMNKGYEGDIVWALIKAHFPEKQ